MPLPVSEVIAALPQPALAIASDEHIIAMNDAAHQLLGMSGQGRHFVTVLRQPSVAEAVEACLADGQPTEAAYLARQNNTDASFAVSVRQVGQTGVVLVTFQDVTMVATAGQMRRDFVANVSHELRTPLTALMGFIETLQGPAKDDAAARARFLGIMQSETERMNRLVGDLLSLSRVEAKERERPKTCVDIASVLGSTLRTLNPVAQAAHVELITDIPSDAVMVLGEADQLHQVFANLIENAIKYGGEGKRVHICLTQVDHAAELRASAVMISVRDEGAGIAARHLPRLTERFYRVDDHRDRKLGGTGLGLAIVKHILNRHQGRIKITSDLGQGSEFKMFLPVA